MVNIGDQQEFSDDDWRAVSAADQSKKLKLLLSGLTTGTTRAWTVPDADGTVLLSGNIGVSVQAYDALLTAIAALTTSAGGFIRTTGSDTVAAQAIVGTASQSGGTPTGALFEYGSNANGVYVRFASNIQVCAGSISMGNRNANGAGTLADPYRSDVTGWTFPAAFSTVPSVAGIAYVASGTAAARAMMLNSGSTNAPSSTGISLQAVAGSSNSTAVAVTGYVIAVGNWF